MIFSRLSFILVLTTALLAPPTEAQFLGIGGDREPKELENLKKQNLSVPIYEKFDEIAPVTPVPGAFRLRLGAVIRMAVFRKQEIQYDIVDPKDYNALEKRINGFFDETGTDRALRLLAYARQLNAAHPYRINPFVPYFTMRRENSLIADEKTGPAAVVADLFRQRGRVEGSINYINPQGVSRQAQVRYRESSLPLTGLMFLFDHDVFSLNDLIRDPKENILQDVILHEFTHIWQNELLTPKNRDRNTVASNMTENGHDTMIVTSPGLAFSEGIAIGFEALYGSKASQLLNMTADERDRFFGNFTNRTRQEMEFLANRQGYVRRNSYLYNLYDFNECTLRVVNTPSSADIGRAESELDDLLASVRRGDRVPLDRLSAVFSWRSFDDRFYSGNQRVSTVHLMNHCEVDSPARLEAKEGLIATLIYNLLYSGALVDSSILDFHRLGENNSEGKKDFKTYLAQAQEWEELFTTTNLRSVAQEDRTNPRLTRAERLFLIGFRNLVLAIKHSQAITIKDLIHGILAEGSPFDEGIRLKTAYQVMKVTKGTWFTPRNEQEREAVKWFESPRSMQVHQEEIVDFLLDLAADRRLIEVGGKLGKTPEVMVSFASNFSNGRSRRINVNVAHHIDLIDMFGTNNEQIASLARRLDQGAAFANDQEFITFAREIGKGAEAQAWIAQAEKELAEVRKLQTSFKFSDLRHHPHR
jgi:hypothetical protein